MKRRVLAFGCAILTAIPAFSVNVAYARAASAPRAVLPSTRAPRMTETPSAVAQHHYFGTLVSADGVWLVIQLRDGRLLRVNAARAFTLNRVSAPFFRGKPTVVTGALGSGGVFYATAVTRAAPLSTNWGSDL